MARFLFAGCSYDSSLCESFELSDSVVFFFFSIFWTSFFVLVFVVVLPTNRIDRHLIPVQRRLSCYFFFLVAYPRALFFFVW